VRISFARRGSRKYFFKLGYLVIDAAAAASGRERADGRELVRALTIAKINIRLLG
jgi:hypothetical protein